MASRHLKVAAEPPNLQVEELQLGELNSVPVVMPLEAEVRVGSPSRVAPRRVGVRAQAEVAARSAGAEGPWRPAAGVGP